MRARISAEGTSSPRSHLASCGGVTSTSSAASCAKVTHAYTRVSCMRRGKSASESRACDDAPCVATSRVRAALLGSTMRHVGRTETYMRGGGKTGERESKREDGEKVGYGTRWV